MLIIKEIYYSFILNDANNSNQEVVSKDELQNEEEDALLNRDGERREKPRLNSGRRQIDLLMYS
jgi:hypothetical protein